MTRAHTDVCTSLLMTLLPDDAFAGSTHGAGVGDSVEVAVVATYESHDPYAVTLRFVTADGHVDWVVSRDVLDRGATAPAGYGDVVIWPVSETVTALTLSSPSGRATLSCPTVDLRAFLAATYEVVEAGRETEHLDIDGLLQRLLATDRG